MSVARRAAFAARFLFVHRFMPFLRIARSLRLLLDLPPLRPAFARIALSSRLVSFTMPGTLTAFDRCKASEKAQFRISTDAFQHTIDLHIAFALHTLEPQCSTKNRMNKERQ
jgi:hypothetical protein